jgi:hypothetical protein
MYAALQVCGDDGKKEGGDKMISNFLGTFGDGQGECPITPRAQEFLCLWVGVKCGSTEKNF